MSPGPVATTATRREPDRRLPADTGRRRSAGSLADLRSRLDRLPDGHPSSPYEDGGVAKPLPHRLKQLELGLPAPEREATDAPAKIEPSSHLPLDHRAASSADLPTAGPAADSEPGQQGGAPSVDDQGPRSVRLNAAGPPALDPPPAETAAAPPQVAMHDGNGQASDPAVSWQAPHAPTIAGNARSRPDQSARRDHGLAPDPERADLDRRVTRDPRTQPYRIGQPQHLSGQPGRNASGASEAELGDRRSRGLDYLGGGDPREAGGGKSVPHGQLSIDHRELVARVLADRRLAEGQNVFGSYGASGLTPAIRRLADQLSHGGLAPGSEAESLKSPERLAAKLAKLADRHPDRTAEELAAGICDVVRYAFAFDADYYTDGTWLVHRKFKAHGFELEARRNRWESPEYKGIWTRWHDPAHDLSFEVQFHTYASWDVVVNTHQAYLAITDPLTPAPERARLRARQVAAATAAKAPPHCAEIADFVRDAR